MFCDYDEQSASVFVNLMFSLVVTMLSAGTVIFCVVMYLMMGVMIDRSAMGISLIKIFGCRPKEIPNSIAHGVQYLQFRALVSKWCPNNGIT